jgi:FemAB-related protein (PEP-CTERM system-associated)
LSGEDALHLRHTAEPPEGWDAFVAATPEGTFCHLSGWGEVLARSFGHEPIYLAASSAGGLRGVLPLVRMPRLGSGRVLVSMPYLNYGGPLGDAAARTALSRAALDEARNSRARRLELRSRRPHEVEVPGLEPGRDKITVVLDLPGDADVLFEGVFRAKLRSQIRRPVKEGMEAVFGLDHLAGFYRVFSENMRDLGTPVLPLSFFTAVRDVFPEHVDFGLVLHEGLPVAAGCGFHLGEEFEMTWASSLRAFNRQAPNMLLYWAFMQRCIERGRTRFNFGRCTPGAGTHRFKLQWGGEDHPLAWRSWPPASSAPDAGSGPMRLATSAWRHLPLSVTNRLGPRLARRIPTF